MAHYTITAPVTGTDDKTRYPRVGPKTKPRGRGGSGAAPARSAHLLRAGVFSQ